MDMQGGRTCALVAERVEDAHVLRCRHRDVEGDDRLRPPVSAEVHTRAWMCAAEHRREVGVDHLAVQPEGLSAGAVPASRQLTASGVVLDLLLCDGLAEVPHRLLDAGELADGDHRENPCCTSSSVGAKRLPSAYIFAVERRRHRRCNCLWFRVDVACARGREGGDKRCGAGAFVGGREKMAGWWQTEG